MPEAQAAAGRLSPRCGTLRRMHTDARLDPPPFLVVPVRRLVPHL